MSAITLNLAVFFAILTFGFASMLALVSLVSAKRYGVRNLGWVAVAFVGLAVKGAYDSWVSAVQKEDNLVPAALDFIVLLFLYASVATKQA